MVKEPPERRLRVPKHVAIIMDGNGRWAERRGHPRVFGHIRGSSRIKPIVKEANRLGIKALTLFAFSTENWSRPEQELGVLWKLLKKYLQKERDELNRENVKLNVIGETEKLSSDIHAVLSPTLELLSQNTGLTLTFALSYGSRKELARAAQLFAEDCLKGIRKPSDIVDQGPELMSHYLWTQSMGNLSDVDLVIRTSGEKRVSNFLLWQSAYAEFIFSDLNWPDFGPEQFRASVEEYSKRDRRFGGLSAPLS
jgi:undecaprenyl diphosphate synthase